MMTDNTFCLKICRITSFYKELASVNCSYVKVDKRKIYFVLRQRLASCPQEIYPSPRQHRVQAAEGYESPRRQHYFHTVSAQTPLNDKAITQLNERNIVFKKNIKCFLTWTSHIWGGCS